MNSCTEKKSNFCFSYLLCLNYPKIWLKMGTVPLSKMALDKKLHKTGGSHMNIHCWGSICDEIKLVLTAALAGVVFKDQK